MLAKHRGVRCTLRPTLVKPWVHPPHPTPTLPLLPRPQPVVVGVPSPNGVAWRKGSLYIGSMDAGKSCRIYRLDNADWFALNRRSATLSDLKIVRGDLPTALAHGCVCG